MFLIIPAQSRWRRVRFVTLTPNSDFMLLCNFINLYIRIKVPSFLLTHFALLDDSFFLETNRYAVPIWNASPWRTSTISITITERNYPTTHNIHINAYSPFYLPSRPMVYNVKTPITFVDYFTVYRFRYICHPPNPNQFRSILYTNNLQIFQLTLGIGGDDWYTNVCRNCTTETHLIKHYWSDLTEFECPRSTLFLVIRSTRQWKINTFAVGVGFRLRLLLFSDNNIIVQVRRRIFNIGCYKLRPSLTL